MYFVTNDQRQTLIDLGYTGDSNEFVRGDQAGFLCPRVEVNSLLDSKNMNYTGANSGYDGIQLLHILGEVPGAGAAGTAATDEDREPSEVPAELEGVIDVEGPEHTWDGRGRMKYLRIVEEELKGIYSKVHVSVPNGEIDLPKDTNNDLNIRIWSSPKQDAIAGGADGTLKPPEKLFGKPVLCRDEMFPSSGKGVDIKDPESGLVLMEYVKPNYLYFSWDAVHKDAKASEHIFRECLKLFKKEIGEDKLRKATSEIAMKRQEEERKALIKFVKTAMDKEFSEARSQIERINQDIEKFQKNLVLKINERANKMLLVDTPEAENLEKRANKMIRDLYSLNHVTGVKVEGTKIMVFTDTIYCEDPRSGILHELGCYRIEIDSGNNRNVRIFNTTRTVKGYESGMQAPHVFHAGNPCLGDLVQSLPDAQAKHDYSTIALLCILFLENVNTNDPAGKYIDRWPKAPEEMQKSSKKKAKKSETSTTGAAAAVATT